MNELCAVPPIILGVWVAGADDVEAFLEGSGDAAAVTDRKQTANLWMTIEADHATQLPVLRSVYSCGNRYPSVSTEFVLYDQPDPSRQQYVQLSPVSLDLSPYASFASSSAVAAPPAKDAASAWQRRIALHTAIANPPSANAPSAVQEMEHVVSQINHAAYLERTLRHLPSGGLPSLRTPALVRAAVRAVWRGVAHVLLLALFCMRVAAEGVLAVLDLRLPRQLLSGVTVKDFSTVALQGHLRLQQWCFWPWQYTLLRRRDPRHPHTARIQYINFLNSMWLVLNDIIIGVCLGYLLRLNADAISAVVRPVVQHQMIDSLDEMVRWLMGWPSGIKLNNNLDDFFGKMCLASLALWKVPHLYVLEHLPTILSLIGLSGVLGATMVVSLLADLFALLGLHVWIGYSIFAAVYNWQLSNLISLYHLFRSQKRNVLRRRVDSCEYDLQQLLLGTVLFTVLIFLLPTTVAYYFLFAGVRVKVLVLQIVLETVLAFLNHFPLFMLTVAMRDPMRLPGGLYFDLLQPGQRRRGDEQEPARSSSGSTSSGSGSSGELARRSRHVKAVSVGRWPAASSDSSSFALHSAQQQQTTYLLMKTRRLPLSRLFFQYRLLGNRLSQHFKPLYVLECLLTGAPVDPVCKLQYPLVPEERPSLANFWHLLHETLLTPPEDGSDDRL